MIPIDHEGAWVVRPRTLDACRSLDVTLRAGEVDREGALEVVALTARAVGHAHRHGLWDGQFEAGAIRVAPGRPPRVLLGAGSDWSFIVDGALQLRRDGLSLHLPTTISPERVGGAGVPVADDVWALGVILFQVLAGRAPFVGSSIPAILRATVRGGPPAPSSLAPDVHPDLDALVLRALADLDARFRDADELADALVDALVSGRALRRERDTIAAGS